MKVVVCGSRKFNDPLVASATIVSRIKEIPRPSLVIHGNAAFSDKFASETAKRLGLAVMEYPADWDTHSDTCRCSERAGWCREAGFRRNLYMLDENPDLVIAFWNGTSTGTKHTITNARKRGLPLEVIRLA